MTRAHLAVSKILLSGITRGRVVLRMEAIIKASRVMHWAETTIECETGVNNHEDPTENWRWPGVYWWLSVRLCLRKTPQMQSLWFGIQEKCLAVNKLIYMAFLVLENVFYCVPRIFIWWELRKLCYPGGKHRFAKPCLCLWLQPRDYVECWGPPWLCA